MVRFACFRLGIAPLKLQLERRQLPERRSRKPTPANCPRISGIPVPELLKSLSANYRKRCPGIAETRKGIAESLYYSWSKEFLEAGKRRLSGDTARAATSSEVKDLRRQAQELKEVVAEQALELRLLKKSMIGDGGDEA